MEKKKTSLTWEDNLCKNIGRPQDLFMLLFQHLCINVLFMSTSLVFFFFLQSKILSSKIYKTITILTEILKAIFNIDIICFHTFEIFISAIWLGIWMQKAVSLFYGCLSYSWNNFLQGELVLVVRRVTVDYVCWARARKHSIMFVKFFILFSSRKMESRGIINYIFL